MALNKAKNMGHMVIIGTVNNSTLDNHLHKYHNLTKKEEGIENTPSRLLDQANQMMPTVFPL